AATHHRSRDNPAPQGRKRAVLGFQLHHVTASSERRGDVQGASAVSICSVHPISDAPTRPLLACLEKTPPSSESTSSWQAFAATQLRHTLLAPQPCKTMRTFSFVRTHLGPGGAAHQGRQAPASPGVPIPILDAAPLLGRGLQLRLHDAHGGVPSPKL